MKAFLLFIFIGGALMSCSDEEIHTKDTCLTNFQIFLTADMDYTSIVETFGEPDKDIGSGIHIYVYELEDDTEIWIGYTDQILYARHVDQDQNILHTLI